MVFIKHATISELTAMLKKHNNFFSSCNTFTKNRYNTLGLHSFDHSMGK